MSSEDDRIVLQDQAERPTAKIGTLVAAGVVVIVAMGFLGSVGSPFQPTSDELPPVTAPPQQPLAVMPSLVDEDFITAVDLLLSVGLDSSIVSQGRWLANPDVPAGIVLSQVPAPGTDVFDPNEVSLTISAGGPVVTWDDVPLALQEMIDDGYEVDRSEPILVVETSAGRVYKTDDLLFGTCAALDLARNTFYDRSFDGLCQVGPPETIVGWLPDGAMFAIEGLPPQKFEDVAGDVEMIRGDGSELVIWGQSWLINPLRQAPGVTVTGNTIRVVGGFYELVISVNNSELTVEDIAHLIEPIDIRGSLVLNISEPLAFGRFADRAPARRYQQADIVSNHFDGVQVTISSSVAGNARITTLPSTNWEVAAPNGYQFAVPTGWTPNTTEPAGHGRVLAAATFEDQNSGEWCEVYPVGSLSQIGPKDAFVGVYTGTSTEFNLWLDHFGPEDVSPVSVADPALQCLEGIEAEIRTSSRFHNRIPLDIVIGFGAEVDDETRQQAFAILDSFETAPDYTSRP